jgi:sn-glycerol 3-phosphate transport system permease protein
MLRIEETLDRPESGGKAVASEHTGALPKLRPAKALVPYLMVAPALSILGVFVIYPIFYMIWLSLFKWNMIGPMKFIGLGNFQALWNDAEFWRVMGNTFRYMAFTVLFSVLLGLLTALHFRKGSRIASFLQSILFTPYVVSLVSVAFVWMWLMDTDFGLLNFLLGLLHMQPLGWLDDAKVALNSLILVSVWKSLGYNTIILLSAMQAVPGYLYEAASLDKGKPLPVFFKITLPMISPTLFFLTLMNMIAAFKVFETVAVMTQGGPVNSTNTLVFNIYQYGFNYYKIGYASAMGVVLMVIIGLCTLIYFRGLGRRVHYR